MARRKSKTILQLEGSKRLVRKLKELGRSAEHELGKSLFREGTEIMNMSKRDFVPVDTGLLRSTGHVQLPRPGPMVLLGYGGPASAYALVQHEGQFKHKVGQRKYLEIPALAAVPGMPYRISKDLNRWLGKATAESARRR